MNLSTKRAGCFLLFNFVSQKTTMTKKFIVINANNNGQNHDKTNVWWKLGRYFIHQDNIRSLSRKGKGTVITMFHGDDIHVDINYDKLSILLPSNKNTI